MIFMSEEPKDKRLKVYISVKVDWKTRTPHVSPVGKDEYYKACFEGKAIRQFLTNELNITVVSNALLLDWQWQVIRRMVTAKTEILQEMYK